MIDLLWKLGWIVWLTAPAFECDRGKRKGDMERAVWKCQVESTVDDTWKEFEN